MGNTNGTRNSANAAEERRMAQMRVLAAIGASILEGDAEATMQLVGTALDLEIDVEELMKRSLIGSMSRVGRDFKNGEFYVPDVLMSARALQAALFILEKRGVIEAGTESLGGKSRGTVVIGTVAGDLHDIGKNIAGLLLQCNGFTVVDLGIDTVPEVFVEAVRTHKPAVLGISAMLTTTMGEMKRILDALAQARLRAGVHVYVSGVPITQEFADAIGADRFCADARESLEYALEVVGSSSLDAKAIE